MDAKGLTACKTQVGKVGGSADFYYRRSSSTNKLTHRCPRWLPLNNTSLHNGIME